MMNQILSSLNEWWTRQRPATQSLPHYIWVAIRNYIRAGTGSRQAAALSYYAIFSVFPLTLLLAVGIGNIVGPVAAEEQIARGLEIFLPTGTVDAIQSALGDSIGQSSSFGLVATAALIWAATNLFTHITLALDETFAAEHSRSIVRQRVLAVIMGLILVVLVLASFVTSGVLRLISAFSPGVPNLWIRIGIFFLPIGLDIVIFALLFRYAPAREVHWDAIWPAAIIGSIGWEFAKGAFEWYLANLATYWIIYGSIAIGIVLLFWAWLIASIFLFSAELCAQLNYWLIAEEDRRAEEQEARRQIMIMLNEEVLPSSPPIAPPTIIIETTPPTQ
ncbi:MAG: YihY/virulence factor BrkB family protein [Phototrophicaceae bacterium]